MEVAIFLRESDEVDNEHWHKFSRRFFKEYRDMIMLYLGYDNLMHYTPSRMVRYPRFFIAVMMVLYNSGVFGCGKKELANTLYEVFCLGKERSTIWRWFYEMPTEYEEELTSFKDYICTQIIKK